MKIKETREQLWNQLTKPRKYLDVCPFCGKTEHTEKEMIVCVTKKFIAQGFLPEGFNSDNLR